MTSQPSSNVGRPLDRQSPLPLWAQLTGELRRRILGGEFAEQLPTEAQLRDLYGVSRQTVREALGRLRAEGLLTAQRGRGTFIKDSGDAPFIQPLGALYSLFRGIESRGIEQRSEVRALRRDVNPAAAAALDLPEAADLVYLERLRLAGGEPLALDFAWMPLDLAEPLLTADFSRTALYDELARRCGVRVTAGSETIRPIVPTAGWRRLLGLPSGIAIFEIERLARAGVRPVEFRRSLVRGDRFSVVAEWSSASSYTLDTASRWSAPDAA